VAQQIIEINDVSKHGAIRDVPGYMLPPEAWTLGMNMQVVDDGLEKMFGWSQVFGTAGAEPHFAMPLSTAAQTFWIWTSLTHAFVWDGLAHTNITRAGGGSPYSASLTEQWNGTLLAGVAILNNGVDVPQAWLTPTAATDLVDLPNWQPTVRAKIIRAFGPYLMAFNVTKTGTNFPHMVKWSHPADPGSVPVSWDETDPTRDAGEAELPDVNAGLIMEALQLGDTMFIYKGSSVWKCRWIGGRFIFDFGKSAWLTTMGILGPRCVATTGDGTRHVVAAQDDVVWHNGSQVVSILNRKQRRRLFNEIDTVNFGASFMLDNPLRKQMMFCYPSSGMLVPDRALVMHYGQGDQWPVTEMDGITFRNGTVGPVEGASDETWVGPDVEWSLDDGPWSTLERRRVIVLNPAASKFMVLDSGDTRDGTVFTGTLQRTGLALLGRRRSGEWIVDHQKMKLFDEFWAKIQGGPVNIRLGAAMRVDGPVTWGSTIPFDPTIHVNGYSGPVSGRGGAIEFSSIPWFRLDGYKVVISEMGEWPMQTL
jgi:hypothetical protein